MREKAKFKSEAGVMTGPVAENSSHDTVGVIHDLCRHARFAEVVRRKAAEPEN